MAGIDPDFDRDHFAVWGRQYAQDVPLIEDQVATYQPDMLLVALGFNDMGWYQHLKYIVTYIDLLITLTQVRQ